MPWMCCAVFLVLSKQWALWLHVWLDQILSTGWIQPARGNHSYLGFHARDLAWRMDRELAEAGPNGLKISVWRMRKTQCWETDWYDWKGKFHSLLYEMISANQVIATPLKAWLKVPVFLVFTHIRISYALCSYNSSIWDRVFSWLL